MIRRVTDWLQLLRLPNVFTAVADVMMGFLVTGRGVLLLPLNLALLVLSSCCLYLGGMVLNDVFDADVDASEQPERPIPSGRISLDAAKAAGWGLLVAGLLVAWFLSIFIANDWRPGVIATLLAMCVLMYDGPLKRTRIAPLIMGECRFLNVLLGMSLTPILWHKFELFIAAGIGIYIFGVTVFARTDANISSRGRLSSGFIILMGGMGLLAAVPMLTAHRPPLQIDPKGWYLLWIVLALITGRRCVMAIFEPSPPRVQSAVRFCVQSLIVLNAAVCVGYAGPYWGFVVLALLAPTIFLTMWLNAT
jgi:4-hydroxybenzoate polyprenyltransferase